MVGAVLSCQFAVNVNVLFVIPYCPLSYFHVPDQFVHDETPVGSFHPLNVYPVLVGCVVDTVNFESYVAV